MKFNSLLLFLVLTILCACDASKKVNKTAQDHRMLYQESITYSMSPSPDKIYTNLIAINPQNTNLTRKFIGGEEHILVVTWKQNVSFYEPFLNSGFYNTGDYPIWVTTAPELYDRMQSENAKDIDMRLKQLLGLPPNATYSYFVEFWVKPGDLFRPCPDNEITDNQCGLCFPDGITDSYKKWVNDNRISRYYNCELYNNYPWSQLGYTYDWNAENESHVGLSEFVIGTNKNLVVNGIYRTEEYLNKQP